jgi:tight adherence protein B
VTIAVFTFALTMTIVFGSYWALVVRPDAQTAGRLRERLRVSAARPQGAPSIIKGGSVEARRDRLLTRWHRRYAVAPTARLVERAGMDVDAARLVSGTAGALTCVIVILRAVQPNWLIALCAGAMTPLVPYVYLRHAAWARLNRFEEIFPDAIDLMARALRAGHAVTTTLAMIADEMPDPVKSEFRVVYEQHNYGLPFARVMKDLAVRVPLIDVRFFVTAVLTQRDTGGNLAEVLDNLAAVTRDRFRMRRQLDVLTAQGRLTGWVLGGFPVVLGLVLFLLRPDHMYAFVRDPLGFRLLELAIALQVIGIVAIRKLVKIEY